METRECPGYLHCTRPRKKASTCLEDLPAPIVFLRDSFEIVLERAVVELDYAHRLGDERVIDYGGK